MSRTFLTLISHRDWLMIQFINLPFIWDSLTRWGLFFQFKDSFCWYHFLSEEKKEWAKKVYGIFFSSCDDKIEWFPWYWWICRDWRAQQMMGFLQSWQFTWNNDELTWNYESCISWCLPNSHSFFSFFFWVNARLMIFNDRYIFLFSLSLNTISYLHLQLALRVDYLVKSLISHIKSLSAWKGL